MGNLNIRTTFGVSPSCCKHEIIYITRGATADLTFDFSTKVYDFENVEQMTFTLKQDKNLMYWNALEYFKATEDVTAKTGKSYYQKELDIKSISGVTFKKVAKQPGEQVQGLYEQIDLQDGKDRTENWQLNDHFSIDGFEHLSWITFTLSSEETKLFSLTTPDNNVAFEVAVRLDTDGLEGRRGKDSILIEPQHPIAVVDSLYSKIGG